VQSHIAGELAARAATVLDDGQTAGLRAMQAELEAAAARGELARVEELNHEVHRTINRAAGAHRLASMLNLFVHYVPRNYYEQVPGWSDATTHDHAAILEALAAGAPDGARAAMAAHITHIGSLLVAHLTESGVLAPAAEPAVASP
jgi:DNA-binding GntR family transcriptional regulator